MTPPLDGSGFPRALLRIATRVLRDLRFRLPTLVAWAILARTLLLLLATPAVVWGIRRLIATSGDFAIGNFEIAAFLLSPPGLAALLLVALSALVATFLQVSGIVFIVGSKRSGPPPTLRGLLRRLGAVFPRLARLGLLLIAAGTVPVAAAAALALLAARLLLSGHDINYLLEVRPPEFRAVVAIAGVLLLLAALALGGLVLRWIFAVPVLLFEGTGARASLRRSRQLTSGGRRRLAAILAIWLGGLLLLSVVVGLATTGIRELLLALVGDAVSLLVLFSAFAIVVELAAAIVTEFLGFNTLSLLTMHLYLDARARAGEPAPDGLPVPPRRTAPRARRWSLGAVVALSVVLVGGATAFATYRIFQRIGDTYPTRITAHRGASERAPENTLAAIRAAIEDGADFAEIDVQETSDGAIVVLHDKDLQRVAGVARNIWEMSRDELRDIDVGSRFDPEFAGERIPSLGEVLEAARGKIRLNVELKYNGHDEDLARRVVDELRHEGFEDDCVVMSLERRGLREVREAAPEIPVGLTVGASIGNVSRLDVDFLAVGARQVNRHFVDRAHRAGKEVWVWTVNDPREVARFIALDVDNIITDDPAMAVEVRKEWNELPKPVRILFSLRLVLGW